MHLNRVLLPGYKVEYRGRKYLIFKPSVGAGNQILISSLLFHAQVSSLEQVWRVVVTEGWVDLSRVRPGWLVGNRYRRS